jgi:hypothetical protein
MKCDLERALGVEVEVPYHHAPLEELIERAERHNGSDAWTASPIAREHFETWGAVFQPPDDEEMILIDTLANGG